MTVEIGANCTVGAAEAAIFSPSTGASSASRSTDAHRLFSGDLAMKIRIVATMDALRSVDAPEAKHRPGLIKSCRRAQLRAALR
jgi:hypothetical protein